MAERNNFEDMYCFRVTKGATLSGTVPADTTGFNSPTHQADTFVAADNGVSGDTRKGVNQDIFGIPLTNHPSMDIGQAIVDQRKAIGISTRSTVTGGEYQQSTRLPVTSWEFEVTKNNIAPFLWAFFGNGISEAAAPPYVKTCIPYIEGNDTAATLACCRVMSTQTGANNSHLFGGCIVNSITFTGAEGQPLKATVSLMGYNAITDFDFGSNGNICVFDNTCSPLMFQNATISLAGTTVNIPDFTLTINNNAVAKYYNTKHPVKFVYGDLTVSGSFRLPWAQASVGGNVELNKFVAGTDSLFIIKWGSGADPITTNGDFMIKANARYEGAPVEGDDETVLNCSFVGALDDSGNKAIEISVADGVDRTI